MLYVFNLNSDVCQFSLNQAGGIKIKPLKWTLTEAHYHPTRAPVKAGQTTATNLSGQSVSVRCEPPYFLQCFKGQFQNYVFFFSLCQWRCTCCGEQGESCSHLHPKWSRAQLELATEGHNHANQERGTEQPTSCCHNRTESLWTRLAKSHTHARTSNLTK